MQLFDDVKEKITFAMGVGLGASGVSLGATLFRRDVVWWCAMVNGFLSGFEIFFIMAIVYTGIVFITSAPLSKKHIIILTVITVVLVINRSMYVVIKAPQGGVNDILFWWYK